MTTEDRDPLLQTLFAESEQVAESAQELDAEAFTARVMAGTRFMRYRALAPWGGAALAIAAGAWYLGVPLEIAQLVAQVLTTTLMDLGEGWLAWVFSPINNVAALLALFAKALRIGRKKIRRLSYAS